jgi:hypothetical protein
MRDHFHGPWLTPQEAEAQNGRELFDSLEQVEADYLDSLTVRPMSALRAIQALAPYLPPGKRDAVPEPARRPYKRAAG